MQPRLRFTQIGVSREPLRLKVEIGNGASVFSTEALISIQQLERIVSGLESFKVQIYGGLFNFQIGEFGCEYSGGALSARLQFKEHGKIFLQIFAQSPFRQFGTREFANEIRLYLLSEPALLDGFISNLSDLLAGDSHEAELELLSWD
jgi:hypothetical protein